TGVCWPHRQSYATASIRDLGWLALRAPVQPTTTACKTLVLFRPMVAASATSSISSTKAVSGSNTALARNGRAKKDKADSTSHLAKRFKVKRVGFQRRKPAFHHDVCSFAGQSAGIRTRPLGFPPIRYRA